MKYMLDTNICVYIIKKKPAKVIGKLCENSVSDICISSITLSELEYGVEKSSKRDGNKIALARFVAPLEIAMYDDMAAGVYGKIRCDLEKTGRPIGPLDTLIASHTLSLGLTLVTNNEKAFRRVPGLNIENWAR